MSNEVTRSHMQRSELHKELGADMFKSWTQDHAQEVLSSERYELWSKEEEKAEVYFLFAILYVCSMPEALET